MNNNDYDIVEQAAAAWSQSVVPPGPSDDLAARTLQQIEQTKPTPLVERLYAMKPFTKIAAAAAVLVVISAVFLFSGGESIALTAVYDKVQAAQAFRYRMQMTMTGMGSLMGQAEAMGDMEMQMEVTISEDYGMKMENHITTMVRGKPQTLTQLVYLLPEDNVMVSIIPEQKMYQTIEFTEDLLKQTKQESKDPREMIRQMLESEYIELERIEINGVAVQGFQSTDPAVAGGIAQEVKAVLWVDVKIGMPVQYILDMTLGENTTAHCVIDRFAWDIPINADDFAYSIPDDYTMMGQMKIPEMNTDAAITGLQTYLQFFGEYPEKVDLMSLMMSFRKLEDNETEFAKAFREKIKAIGDDQSRVQAFIQDFMQPFQALGMFHMKLLQDKKDPAYYGDTVTPADGDKVLMRWKNDDGTWTVIFGDLTTGEMTYDDMVQLEPNTP